MKVRLDSAGIAAMLRSSEVADVVRSAADAVASAAEGDAAVVRNGVPVKVLDGVSDRARSVVALAHPAGLGIQAKHGSLSRAVSTAGLTVRSKA